MSLPDGSELPPEVDRAARSRDLGELELSDGIVQRPVDSPGRQAALVMIAAGLAAVTVMVIVRPDWLDTVLPVLQIAWTVTLLRWAIRGYRRRRGLDDLHGGVWLFARGIVGQLPGGPPVALRWAEVTAVRRRSGQLWVEERGEAVGVDRSYPRLMEIEARVAAATTERLVAETEGRLARGEAVRFGSALVQREGLRSADDRVLPWSRVDAVVVDRDSVRIRGRDTAADWTTLRLDQTPNVDVLRALVERRQASQPVGDEGHAVN